MSLPPYSNEGTMPNKVVFTSREHWKAYYKENLLADSEKIIISPTGCVLWTGKSDENTCYVYINYKTFPEHKWTLTRLHRPGGGGLT